jgi:O-antigen ligase
MRRDYPIIMASKPPLWPIPVLAALFNIAVSGSRASLASIAVGGVALVFAHRKFWPRGLAPFVIAPASIAGLLLAFQAAIKESADTTAIAALRTGNSRQETWSEAIQLIRGRPVFGNGLGYDEIVDPASSVIKILLEGGLTLALISAIAIALHLRRVIAAEQTYMVVLFLMGITNALFESWLFSGGSAFMLTFWLLVDTRYSAALRHGDCVAAATLT